MGGSREGKRTFKEKLHSLIQEAEAAEAQAYRESQLHDRKSLCINLLVEGRPQVCGHRTQRGDALGPKGAVRPRAPRLTVVGARHGRAMRVGPIWSDAVAVTRAGPCVGSFWQPILCMRGHACACQNVLE